MLSIGNDVTAQLFFKTEILHEGKKMYQYSTVVNPHMRESTLNKFIDMGRNKFVKGSPLSAHNVKKRTNCSTRTRSICGDCWRAEKCESRSLRPIPTET